MRIRSFYFGFEIEGVLKLKIRVKSSPWIKSLILFIICQLEVNLPCCPESLSIKVY
jgi:hypothetical protein